MVDVVVVHLLPGGAHMDCGCKLRAKALRLRFWTRTRTRSCDWSIPGEDRKGERGIAHLFLSSPMRPAQPRLDDPFSAIWVVRNMPFNTHHAGTVRR